MSVAFGGGFSGAPPVSVDTVAPVMTAGALPETSPAQMVAFAPALAAADDVGVTGYAVTVDTATVPALEDFGAAPPTVDLGAPGPHTVRAYARDAAGNVSGARVMSCLREADASAEVLPVITASRVTGVAPLLVHFSADQTTATTTDKPFHDLDYTFDFGDAASGTWARTDGASQNSEFEPLAEHVYEQPGTYTVALTVRDAAGHSSTVTTEITVTDPEVVYAGANTVCFSNDADFTGAPPGSTHITTSTFEYLTVPDNRIPGTRYLFKRGHVFDDATGNTMWINSPGPCEIGAFGVGPNPVAQMHGEGERVLFGFLANASDWRVTNWTASGTWVAPTGEVGGESFVQAAGPLQHLLLWNVELTASPALLITAGTVAPYYLDVPDCVGVVNCSAQCNGLPPASIYATATRLGILGSVIRNSLVYHAQHLVRLPYFERFFAHHCVVGTVQNQGHAFKLHAPHLETAGVPQPWIPEVGQSKWFSISRNTLDQSLGGCNYPVIFGPQNDTFDERVSEGRFRNNFYIPGPDQVMAIVIGADNVSVEDNIFRMSVDGNFVGIEQRDPPLAPVSGVRVVHNTFVLGVNLEPYVFPFAPYTDPADDGAWFANNLVVAPAFTAGATEGAQLWNNWFATAAHAHFVQAIPTQPMDFGLQADSPAVGVGSAALGTMLDYRRVTRGAPPSAGAFDYP